MKTWKRNFNSNTFWWFIWSELKSFSWNCYLRWISIYQEDKLFELPWMNLNKHLPQLHLLAPNSSKTSIDLIWIYSTKSKASMFVRWYMRHWALFQVHTCIGIYQDLTPCTLHKIDWFDCWSIKKFPMHCKLVSRKRNADSVFRHFKNARTTLMAFNVEPKSFVSAAE